MLPTPTYHAPKELGMHWAQRTVGSPQARLLGTLPPIHVPRPPNKEPTGHSP